MLGKKIKPTRSGQEKHATQGVYPLLVPGINEKKVSGTSLLRPGIHALGMGVGGTSLLRPGVHALGTGRHSCKCRAAAEGRTPWPSRYEALSTLSPSRNRSARSLDNVR